MWTCLGDCRACSWRGRCPPSPVETHATHLFEIRPVAVSSILTQACSFSGRAVQTSSLPRPCASPRPTTPPAAESFGESGAVWTCPVLQGCPCAPNLWPVWHLVVLGPHQILSWFCIWLCFVTFLCTEWEAAAASPPPPPFLNKQRRKQVITETPQADHMCYFIQCLGCCFNF